MGVDFSPSKIRYGMTVVFCWFTFGESWEPAVVLSALCREGEFPGWQHGVFADPAEGLKVWSTGGAPC